MTEQYSMIRMTDRTKVRLGIFEPENKPKGVIQLVHGFGEYIGHYLTVIDFFVNEGYICVMHDQRGHGVLAAAKPKTRGVVSHYDRFLSDCLEIRDLVAKEFPDLPVFLFGHSMGGNIALNLLLKNPDNQKLYQKAIIESPWLELEEPPSAIIQSLAKNVGKFNSKIRVHTKLKVSAISHHKDLVNMITKDGIYHDIISLRLFSQIKEAGEFAQENVKKLEIPTLLFGAEKDGICSASAIRKFSQNAGSNLKFIEVKDGYHALHIDTQALFFLEKCTEFLDQCM